MVQPVGTNGIRLTLRVRSCRTTPGGPMAVRRPSVDAPDVLAKADHRKRRVYALAAVAGCAVVVLSWLVRDPGDAFLTRVYPWFAIFLGGFAALTWVQRLSVRHLEALVLAPITLVIMGRLAWLLYAAEPLEERLLLLAGAHYWAVGVLILAGFVLLDLRAGIRYGFGIILVSALFVATGVGSEFETLGWSPPVVYLLRIHAFLLLILVLSAGVGTLRSQLQRALARAEAYEELARSDHLTGLLNRRAAAEALEREAGAKTRYSRDVSIITLDVDRFKAINDRFGHQAGDQVLVALANTLREHVRHADLVARWGGEEFLVIAPHADRDQAATLAERCRAAVAETRPAGIEVTATFGVAQMQDGEAVDELLARADQLLYDAKDAGRNRVMVHTAAGAASDSPSSVRK